MPQYEATVSADFSGYTNSVQQAIALTKEYAAANEGLSGAIGRIGSAGIVKFNDALGLQKTLLKANVAEASNYQQVLGRVSAQAVAAGRSVTESQRATREIARQMTGDIGSATQVVSAVQQLGITEPKGLKATAKAVMELGAATGESGTQIASSITSIQRSFSRADSANGLSALGDSLTTVTAKFGGSAAATAQLASQIAPFAKQVGISQSQLIGFSEAFARMGEDGFRTANVFNKVLNDIDQSLRNGGPALDIYAKAMGVTSKQARSMVETNPAQFFIEFMDSLEKQGPDGIRILEELGLEGVRSQRVLASLRNSDLSGTVQTAQESYGSGTTQQAAAEQLEGLNEQALKLQESLKQVAATSGQPFLSFLETTTGLATKAADALAGITGSETLQNLFKFIAPLGAAGAIGKIGFSAITSYGTVGALYAGLNNIGGREGMLSRGVDWAANNRRLLAGAGAAGLGLGAMGVPGGSVIGTAALIAAATAGTPVLGYARKGFEFFTRDVASAAITPMRDWGRASGREARLRGRYEGDLWSDSRTTALGMRFYNPMEDLSVSLKKQVDDLAGRSIALPENMKKTIDEASRIYNTGGKGGYFERQLVELREMMTGTDAQLASRAGKITAATNDLRNALDSENFPGQSYGLRGRAMARNIAGTAAMTATGLVGGLGQLAPFMANPWVLGGTAVAGIAGYGIWRNQRADENERSRGNMAIEGRDRIAETYGLIPPVFQAITLSGQKVASTFDSLVDSIKSQQGTGGPQSITRSQYSAIDRSVDPAYNLRFQNYMVGNWRLGPSKITPDSRAELLGLYGTAGTEEQKATLYTELARNGKTYDEILGIERDLQVYYDDQQKVLDAAIEVWNENKGDSTAPEQFKNVLLSWAADNKNMGPQEMTRQILLAFERGIPQFQLSAEEADRLMSEVFQAVGLDVPAPQFNFTPSTALSSLGDSSQARFGRVPDEPAEGTSPGQASAVPTEADIENLTADFMAKNFKRYVGDVEGELAARGLLTGSNPLSILLGQGARQNSAVNTPGGGGPVYGPFPGVSGMDYTQQQGAADALAQGQFDYFQIPKTDTGERFAQAQALAVEAAAALGGLQPAIESLMAQSAGAGPEEKALAEAGAAFLNQQQELGYAGMGPLQAAMARRDDAASSLAAAKALAESDTSNADAQQQYIDAQLEFQQATGNWMNAQMQFLKSLRQFEDQQRYRQEDYARSVGYAKEDYGVARGRAQEAFDRQQRYAQEDQNRQMAYMQADYQKGIERSERDYFRARERSAADFAKQMKRAGEDAAKGLYDPFKRLSVEQVWSGGGLLVNIGDQLERFQAQVSNLDKLRGAGLNQQVIDILGLSDPNKAQQVQRLMDDIAATPELAAQLNQAIAARVGVSGQLSSPENNMDLRRVEEDYKLSLERQAEDRRTYLADAEKDYQLAVQRATEQFAIAMLRAEEQFKTSMNNMAQDHKRALNRMAEAEEVASARSREQWERQFEGITTEYAKLASATSAAIEGETLKWDDLVVTGFADMSSKINGELVKFDEGWAKTLAEKMAGIYGINGKFPEMMGLIAQLMALGAAGGGGSAPPATYSPYGTDSQTSGTPDYDGPNSPAPANGKGYLFATGNRGNITQHYMNKSPRYRSGYHSGVDIGVPYGTPLYSTLKGVVVRIDRGYVGGHGNRIIISNRDSRYPEGGATGIHYGHMSSFNVKVGQEVQRGTIVGASGGDPKRQGASAGKTTGPHLHFQAYVGSQTKNGQWVYPGPHKSPYNYMLAEGGIAVSPTSALIAEAGHPEAVIPLNQRGIDILASALEKAFGSVALTSASRESASASVVTYIVHEDHSVQVHGKVEVVSQDPERVGRELARRARDRALVSPSRTAP